MNTSQSYRAALFLLVLLVSHEGITLANNIRQTKILRKNVELQESLQDLTELANLDELDSSFLETENRQGCPSTITLAGVGVRPRVAKASSADLKAFSRCWAKTS